MIMKKGLFSCFHPLVLETQTDQTNANHKKKCHKSSSQRNNSKRPLSHVLEILLPKASLKIKVSGGSIRQPQKISGHLQIFGNGKTTRDGGVEEAKVLQPPVGSSSSSPSSNESFDHGEICLETRPCSCKINPGLYLLIATLFFTVVWGRVRAVVFALMLLYLFPMWGRFLR
ncbi:hypothetical protein SASPL_121755 [Salvia splendens]|uniref:Uncharacterized protein n=1 Tax=Salvia splendens TaxID=180675 RepID=A0A8X8ZWH5_SALSN|nr:hypothetical protein SASPL_121755 [Salvia splendens]